MKNILLVSDLGGFPPSVETLSKLANVSVYVPRPSAVTRKYMETVHRYAHAVLQERTAFSPSGYVHPDWVTFKGAEPYTLSDDEMVEAIISAARKFEADGIIFGGAENMVLSVARAAEALGLRSAGVMPARRARNKLTMRETFRSAAVPSPEFRAINSEEDLRDAVRELGYPLVLKPTYLACSIGVTLLDGTRDPIEVYRQVRQSISADSGDLLLFNDDCLFIVESYMEGCNADWYDDPRFADYVSVEGMMVGGRYHPIAITDKAPMHSSFTETAHIVPSVLDEEARAIIVEACRKANESLGLENCPTHTEVKLMKNRQVGIIETAARFGGWNIIPQINQVYGLDLTKAWAEVILYGQTDELPATCLAESSISRCNVRIYLEDDVTIKSNQSYQYNGHTPLDELLPPGVKLVQESEIALGSTVSTIPELNAMSFVSTLDLEAEDSRSLGEAVQQIRHKVRLDVEKLPNVSITQELPPKSSANETKEALLTGNRA
ncbi:ATP-grasp domain-containing protein [Paenibacillus xylaniclasticus]|uniref:ATP-grasp domain-containing protein n=1 Tax=Paenibacillus xylaniclasticus TaxID=588083 RepID=UPI000FD82F70|nr:MULTISPECIES: ATP-grasp domain-containing protein [Paenibacillus]GFN32283.1 alanine--anticapsin ligase [Paenibacillus curdlanolyticus]